MTTASDIIREEIEILNKLIESGLTEGFSSVFFRRAALQDILPKIQELENNWISVEEMLPDEEKEYLVIDTYGKSFVCGYTVSCGFDSDVFYTDELTHWMPLPKNPITNNS